MKQALITGITGQDGPYLANFLLSKGYKVFGTYRRSSTPNFWRLQEQGILNKITLIPADLSDMSSLLEAVSISEPHEIYNLAAQSFVGSSFDQPLFTTDIDANGSTRFLEIIRHLKKEIKFYQASTSELFGGSLSKLQDEKTPMVPNSPYAVAKLHSFHMCRIYRSSYGLHASNGILFNHECISENAPVIVKNKKTSVISIKRIKDIRRAREKNKLVQQWLVTDLEIWDGDNFVDLQLLTATKRKTSDDNFCCKTINTRNGVVETTNHHNMLLQNESKEKAKMIEIGCKLSHKEFPYQTAISNLTWEEATFLGMMVGDGYISKDGRGQFSNNNEKVMEEFCYLWKRVSLGYATIRKFKTEYGWTIQAKLRGNPNYLRQIKEEIYTYDGFKKIPDRILNAEKEIQRSFLTGYNLTDGLKSNPCTYEFRNFKTNSILLAQGLLFLINQTTMQEFNITFEQDQKYYGYYSINLLSPVNRAEKEETVKELLQAGYSQRRICQETGISRTFISKINGGGEAVLVSLLAQPKEEVKKVLYHPSQPTWVYDVKTASGKLMAGVGKIVVANSPLRGLEFVTRKITNAVARIKLEQQKNLSLGNLHTKRDWGYAPEYCRAMYLMLQQENADDYVVATGETHSVSEFAEEAFNAVGLNWKDYVLTDQRLHRPMDIYQLCGNPRKAERALGWKSQVNFKQLVQIMVKADLERWEKYLRGESFPWDAPSYSSEMEIISRNVTRDAQLEVSAIKKPIQNIGWREKLLGIRSG